MTAKRYRKQGVSKNIVHHHEYDGAAVIFSGDNFKIHGHVAIDGHVVKHADAPMTLGETQPQGNVSVTLLTDSSFIYFSWPVNVALQLHLENKLNKMCKGRYMKTGFATYCFERKEDATLVKLFFGEY